MYNAEALTIVSLDVAITFNDLIVELLSFGFCCNNANNAPFPIDPPTSLLQPVKKTANKAIANAIFFARFFMLFPPYHKNHIKKTF